MRCDPTTLSQTLTQALNTMPIAHPRYLVSESLLSHVCKKDSHQAPIVSQSAFRIVRLRCCRQAHTPPTSPPSPQPITFCKGYPGKPYFRRRRHPSLPPEDQGTDRRTDDLRRQWTSRRRRSQPSPHQAGPCRCSKVAGAFSLLGKRPPLHQWKDRDTRLL